VYKIAVSLTQAECLEATLNGRCGVDSPLFFLPLQAAPHNCVLHATNAAACLPVCAPGRVLHLNIALTLQEL
jgi:hypothetical protein